MPLRILDTIKNLPVERCFECHKRPELVCEWIDDDSFIPDEPDESYPIDDQGWQHARPVDMNTHRVFALGLKHKCGEHYPFQIVKYYLLPRSFNVFPDNVCITLNNLINQIKGWDNEWTKEYIGIIEEWNTHFGEVSGTKTRNEEEDTNNDNE